MDQLLPWRTQVAVSTCRFPFSISMTTCSTVLALGMMPLCLLIYTKLWVNSGMIVIPFDNIGKSLLRQISRCSSLAGSPGGAWTQLVFASPQR